jgi:hypothetical protein
MPALAYAIQLLSVLPQLILAGQDVMELINKGQSTLQNMQDEKRDPTPAEWEALDSLIATLRKDLHD